MGENIGDEEFPTWIDVQREGDEDDEAKMQMTQKVIRRS